MSALSASSDWLHPHMSLIDYRLQLFYRLIVTGQIQIICVTETRWEVTLLHCLFWAY